MAKRPPKKEFALVNLNRKCLVLRAGKPVTILAKQPPRGDAFPLKYRQVGYSYEPVEIEHSPRHSGEPIYELRDSQKGTVTKVMEIN
jgi:hypothetical protein